MDFPKKNCAFFSPESSVRVLLTSNACYAPPRGGSTRSNLIWLRNLAENGHECRVVAAREQDTPGEDEFIDGIRILSVRDRPSALRSQIESWKPDWVLISSEDLGHTLLRGAFRAAPDRIVYLAHTPQFFPFGPESWHLDSGAAELLRKAAAIVAISRTVSEYIETNMGIKAAVIHPPLYGAGPWKNLANARGAVTMVNPCAVKGVSIFLALADRFPETEFHTLRGWGTTSQDEAELRRRPNVKVIETVRDIEEQLARTRVLLMPSLWFEGFGLIVTEAMLRGVPVLASDTGGLAESKLGTGFTLPVKAITEYEPRFDDRNMPVAVLPPQPVERWASALKTLLSDDDLYRQESAAAQAAASRFVNMLNADALMRLLERLPRQTVAATGRSEMLSPAQRALLLRKIRERG